MKEILTQREELDRKKEELAGVIFDMKTGETTETSTTNLNIDSLGTPEHIVQLSGKNNTQIDSLNKCLTFLKYVPLEKYEQYFTGHDCRRISYNLLIQLFTDLGIDHGLWSMDILGKHDSKTISSIYSSYRKRNQNKQE
jgi:acyl carrier protein